MTRFFSMFLLAMAMCLAATGAKAAPASANKTAILAGGCFWCVESDFDKAPGVVSTVSGYTGGTTENPTYENYHDEGNGVVPHVEAVEITYDPAVTNYADLLTYYFHHIDPTDNGGQFCDRGPAYRPVIFTNGEEEKKIAEDAKQAAAKTLNTEIKVDILPVAKFWPAEDYHQDYHDKNTTKYKYYRWRCGRDARVEDLWGKAAH